MNTKYLFTAIAVVVLLVIGLFLYNQKNKTDVSNTNSTTSNANLESNDNANEADINANDNTNLNSNTTNSNTNSSSTNANGNSNANTNKAQSHTVTFDGKAFSPSTLTINSGDTVVFKNTSSGSFWPASDPHPTHTNYPGFDAKQGISSGQSYQFTFTKTGSWGYHDHLDPSIKGTIIVK